MRACKAIFLDTAGIPDIILPTAMLLTFTIALAALAATRCRFDDRTTT